MKNRDTRIVKLSPFSSKLMQQQPEDFKPRDEALCHSLQRRPHLSKLKCGRQAYKKLFTLPPPQQDKARSQQGRDKDIHGYGGRGPGRDQLYQHTDHKA